MNQLESADDGMGKRQESMTYMVATLQAGFHCVPNKRSGKSKRAKISRTDPGWKSDIEKQILLSGWKRPLGVNIYSNT